MAMSDIEVKRLVWGATNKNMITRDAMERLGKELYRRFRKGGLDSQPERIVLAAYISHTEHIDRMRYINERMAEWRRKISRKSC